VSIWQSRLGCGTRLAPDILTNKQLEQMVQSSDSWIVERTGIKERRIASPDLTTSQLCCEAAQMALHNAGIDPRELGLIM
jgi:3-oxoacyl-[acyl-carrier-protein] synthase-3